jgi:glycosyltransferase involved in cell wall biosynthesis
MKIGYDAKRLFTNFTGLGNYSRSLVSLYHLAYTQEEIFLFTPVIQEDPRTVPFLNSSSYQIIRPKGFKPLWRTADIIKDIHRSGVDVFHGLSHELPMGISRLDIGTVVTMHDLIFKYYPQDNSWIDRTIYDMKWKHASMTADRIVAISEQTKKDLVHYYNIGPEKIQVIYQSADPIFSRAISTEELEMVKQHYHLPAVYNLYTGSVISRKNLLCIIEAMIRMKPSERVPLVIIGHGKDYKKTVQHRAEEGNISESLIWMGSPRFEDFPAIYRGAQMMIYPSFHEGFGLPVIEAMHTGIPVITSDRSSLAEAGGDAAMLINPSDPESLLHAMSILQSDPKMREDKIRKGFEHIRKFEPSLLIKSWHQLYQQLV